MQVVINLSEMNLVRGFLSLNYRQWKAKIEKVTFYCSVLFYPERRFQAKTPTVGVKRGELAILYE